MLLYSECVGLSVGGRWRRCVQVRSFKSQNGKETVKLLCQQGVCIGSCWIAALEICDMPPSLPHLSWVVVRQMVVDSPHV